MITDDSKLGPKLGPFLSSIRLSLTPLHRRCNRAVKPAVGLRTVTEYGGVAEMGKVVV